MKIKPHNLSLPRVQNMKNKVGTFMLSCFFKNKTELYTLAFMDRNAGPLLSKSFYLLINGNLPKHDHVGIVFCFVRSIRM